MCVGRTCQCTGRAQACVRAGLADAQGGHKHVCGQDLPMHRECSEHTSLCSPLPTCNTLCSMLIRAAHELPRSCSHAVLTRPVCVPLAFVICHFTTRSTRASCVTSAPYQSYRSRPRRLILFSELQKPTEAALFLFNTGRGAPKPLSFNSATPLVEEPGFDTWEGHQDLPHPSSPKLLSSPSYLSSPLCKLPLKSLCATAASSAPFSESRLASVALQLTCCCAPQ